MFETILVVVCIFMCLVLIGMCSDYIKERDVYRERWLNAQNELIRTLERVAEMKGIIDTSEDEE